MQTNGSFVDFYSELDYNYPSEKDPYSEDEYLSYGQSRTSLTPSLGVNNYNRGSTILHHNTNFSDMDTMIYHEIYHATDGEVESMMQLTRAETRYYTATIDRRHFYIFGINEFPNASHAILNVVFACLPNFPGTVFMAYVIATMDTKNLDQLKFIINCESMFYGARPLMSRDCHYELTVDPWAIYKYVEL